MSDLFGIRNRGASGTRSQLSTVADHIPTHTTHFYFSRKESMPSSPLCAKFIFLAQILYEKSLGDSTRIILRYFPKLINIIRIFVPRNSSIAFSFDWA